VVPTEVVAVEVAVVEEEVGTLVVVIIVVVLVEVVEEIAAQDAGGLAQDQDHLREGGEDQDHAPDPEANPGTEPDVTDLHPMSARGLQKEDLSRKNERSQQKNVQHLLKDDHERGHERDLSQMMSMPRKRGLGPVQGVGQDLALEMTTTKTMTRTSDWSKSIRTLAKTVSSSCCFKLSLTYFKHLRLDLFVNLVGD